MNISSIVKLLIVDEVHLLNDERGPVIETIVSRTQRQVETSQSMIRIVGLSATLPNPKDVGKFLGVSESTGLFHFDNRYRPVPLHQSFLGVKDRNAFERQKRLNELAYKKAIQAIKGGKQAMIFVHSRKETARTARSLREHSTYNDEAMLFDCSDAEGISEMNKEIKRSRNKEIQEFFPHGLGIHHAGMLRSDRSLMERAFRCGALKVLVCTGMSMSNQ
jgi:activating signal cointegrator complex subunit 3